jgi:hypothetical protein
MSEKNKEVNDDIKTYVINNNSSSSSSSSFEDFAFF